MAVIGYDMKGKIKYENGKRIAGTISVAELFRMGIIYLTTQDWRCFPRAAKNGLITMA